MFDLEVVLSLFDGAGMGQEALKRAGITYRQYLASEIDKPAMRVAMRNHPWTTQLGDIRNLKGENLPPISLLMGGSPCQGFSYANTSKDKKKRQSSGHSASSTSVTTEYNFELMIRNLKILGNVKANDKLVKHGDTIKLDSPYMYQGISRYWHGDSRKDSLNHIEQLIESSFTMIDLIYG